MAVVYDRDGNATAGGMAAIRDAFVTAADGKLVCLDATMGYDHSAGPNAQVLTFKGKWADDGSPFEVKSPPILAGLPLAQAARRLAQWLVNERAGAGT